MDIQAAVPIHLLFIVQGVTVIIVAFGNAVAVAQQLHDGAVARCVLFQYIACCFRHGNGADDGLRLRAEDCLTAVAFAYQRGRRIQTTLEFVCFQHCRRRAFVGQMPFIFSGADADFAFFFQCFEQGVGLRAAQFACAFFIQRQFAQRFAVQHQFAACCHTGELTLIVVKRQQGNFAGYGGVRPRFSGKQDGNRRFCFVRLISGKTACAGIVASDVPVLVILIKALRRSGQCGGGQNSQQPFFHDVFLQFYFISGCAKKQRGNVKQRHTVLV